MELSPSCLGPRSCSIISVMAAIRTKTGAVITITGQSTTSPKEVCLIIRVEVTQPHTIIVPPEVRLCLLIRWLFIRELVLPIWGSNIEREKNLNYSETSSNSNPCIAATPLNGQFFVARIFRPIDT
ncbi:hypothetical protein AVEN_117596-1 [Araneus ventricosus]|uniref:Uncharacterized protein n=1 Tax=Araneus ventricosus TaxID=182803 RepID=A0A4Y2GD39_ARAVE|nr:hypothetical protein AVEN_117596-1 [Araneus ventricosus]